jgi:hypothetical protein
MTSRLLLILATMATVAVGCSRSPETATSASPLAPSDVTLSHTTGGPWRPAVVTFPPREEGMDFRVQLENKYVSRGRTPAQTYVDMEGEIVWMGEYNRYRVNGCDHTTAMQYVRTEIDSGVTPPVCSVSFFPENAIYPPREQSVDFRHQLGRKYQSMGRSATSAVDADGAGVWISEYFRYRTSGCDHPTATQKVMTQIDGNPAPETCLAQCSYRVNSQSVGAAGGNFRAEPERTSGTCDWIAESEVPWISLDRPVTGTNRSPLSYTVDPNSGGPRTGSIRISYPNGQIRLDVDQSSPSHSLAFAFFDPARSTSPVTECQIRSTTTICTLTAVVTLPAAVSRYEWVVEYAYDGSRVWTQSGQLPTLSFTESCAASPGSGAVIPVSVSLTAVDVQGNSATIYSGQGSQPALQLRSFPCS